jgi:hypothetical protein
VCFLSWRFYLGLWAGSSLNHDTPQARFFRTANILFNNEGTRIRCAFGCRHHFKNKNNTAPQGHNLESDQANRSDDADRGTCDLAVFGTLLCPEGRGGILYHMQTPQARNLLLSLHGVLPGTKVAGL